MYFNMRKNVLLPLAEFALSRDAAGNSFAISRWFKKFLIGPVLYVVNILSTMLDIFSNA